MIADKREQNLWFAFISAFFGATTSTLYYIIQYLAEHGTPQTDSQRIVFQSIVTGSSLSALIVFVVIFIPFWLILRRAWQKRPGVESRAQDHEAHVNETQRTSKHRKVATDALDSSNRAFVVAAILFTVALVGLTVMFIPEILAADGYARYSFSVSGLVAVALFVYSLYFAKRDSTKTQSILGDLNKVVAEQASFTRKMNEIIDMQSKFAEREQQESTKRKEIWVTVAYERLMAIRQLHVELVANIETLLKHDFNTEIACTMLNWSSASQGLVREYYLPQLQEAMNHLAELLNDPSLFTDMALRYRDLRYLLEPLPQLIANKKKDELLSYLESAKLIGQESSQFIERLKKERV